MRLLSKSCDSVKVYDNNQSAILSKNSNNGDQSSDGNYEVEDNESVSSDDSDLWLPKINFSNRYSVNRQVPNNTARGTMKRKYRTEDQKLHDNVSPHLRGTRLRSGRNWENVEIVTGIALCMINLVLWYCKIYKDVHIFNDGHKVHLCYVL